MKKILLSLSFLSLAVLATAQAQWRCLYSTYDDDACVTTNATGHNTIGVGVIRENMFVALVTTRVTDASQIPTRRCFMIPYRNADSTNGRRYTFGYGSQTNGVYQRWSDGGFDEVGMFNAFSIVATPDSFIYIANNDPEHNILVFKYLNDSISVPPPFPRTATGLTGIYGIALDNSKRVYVCSDTSTGIAQDVRIYAPASTWGPTHAETPLRTIDLPNGIYKGIAVTPDGGTIFISDFSNRRVLKYTGSVAAGYTQSASFNFSLGVRDTIPAAGNGSRARPIGLAYLSPNNILAVACDTLFGGSASYTYGRIYLVNPNTGALVSTDTSISIIDAAAWNFAITGAYNNRTCGHGNASGYTSTYDVKFDQNRNLYSQSYYGWTIEKWRYNGTLPTISSVENIGGAIPESFILKQNYPNPFNPTTTIEFSLRQSGFVSLKVYDVLGKEVATLVNDEQRAGNYKVTFDAGNLPSGTYFYTLKSGVFAQTRKLTVVK
jgi:hypothetical protein